MHPELEVCEVKHPLRVAREKKGFTQVELAEALGLNQSEISRLESSDVTLSVHRLIEISRVLKVRPGRLCDALACWYE